MAITRAYYAIDMDDVTGEIGPIKTTIKNNSQIQGVSGIYKLNLYGNFHYDSYGRLTGGTLNSVNFYQSTNILWEMSGLSSLNLVKIINYAINNDIFGFANYIMSGNDTIYGSPENDVLNGYAGNDLVYGNKGNDVLKGGNGNDTLRGDAGNDILNGGNGFDWASYSTATTSVTVNLAVSSAQNTVGAGTDTLAAIENLLGSNYNDKLTGNGLNNSISAGSGNDTLTGGLGNDLLNGGIGTDLVSYSTATKGVTVNLTLSVAQNTVGAGFDTLAAIENLLGGNYNDKLIGNTLNNAIWGGSGNDTLIGASGNDFLTGNTGKDNLNGGSGADSFDFNSVSETGLTGLTWDVISDFKSSELDKIDLSSIDAKVVTTGVNEAFTFIGGKAFSAAGQLRFDAATHLLFGSIDADSAAELAIQLTGINSLTASNFVL